MDVSENSGFSPQIIHFNRVFHYKPSILGYPYFWKHPYSYIISFRGVTLPIGALTPLVTVVGGTPCMNSIFFGVPPPENKQRYANVPVK